MVTLTAPVEAVLFAASVIVLLVDVGFVLNVAVTPLGSAPVERVTLPLKPFCGVTDTVLVPLPPCTTLTLLGEADSVKLGGTTAFTVRETIVVDVSVPDVPVTVTVAGPGVAVLLALNVSVLLLPVVGLGLNVAVTPFGSVEVVNVTLPLKPFCGATLMLLDPLAP